MYEYRYCCVACPHSTVYQLIYYNNLNTFKANTSKYLVYYYVKNTIEKQIKVVYLKRHRYIFRWVEIRVWCEVKIYAQDPINRVIKLNKVARISIATFLYNYCVPQLSDSILHNEDILDKVAQNP